MLTEFEVMWDGHLGRINLSKYQIDLLNDQSSPVRSISYQAEPGARQFLAAEKNWMLAEKVIKPATTEWAAPNVFGTKNGGSLRCCMDYRNLLPKHFVTRPHFPE